VRWHRRAAWFQRGVIVVMLLWSLFPIYWAINTSFMTQAEAQSRPSHWIPDPGTVHNYVAALGSGTDSGEVTRSLLNSSIEALGATIFTVVLSVLGGYAFARLRFRFRRLLFYTILATLALPGLATLIALYKMLSEVGLDNTYTGVILVYVSGAVPLGMWIMHNAFNAIPVSLEEAAVVDGAGRFKVFLSISLPIARTGVAASGIITFLFCWSQFTFPLVLTNGISTEPVTVLLPALVGTHQVAFTLENAVAVLAIVLPIVLVIVLNKWIVSGILSGSVK
jgi:multiple sugar transport system permease protein